MGAGKFQINNDSSATKNLHHSRVAMAVLFQKILSDSIEVVLSQKKPWTFRDRIMGMSTGKGKLLYDTDCDNWACIYISRNIETLQISNLSSRDCAVTTRNLTITTSDYYKAAQYK